MPDLSGTIRRGGKAGRFRQSFTIVEYTDSSNSLGAGGGKTATIIYSNVRGRLNDLSGKEMEIAKRLEMDTSHECEIWARGYTLKPGYVFRLDGTSREFELVSIEQYENRDEVFKLKLMEYGVQSRG